MGVNKKVTLTVDIQAQMSNLQGQVGKMQQILKGLKMPENLTDSTTKDVNSLLERIKKIQDYTVGNKINLLDEKKVQSELAGIQKDFNHLVDRVNASGKKIKLGDNNIANAITKAIDDYEKGIKASNDEYRKQNDYLDELIKKQRTLKSISDSSAKPQKDAEAAVETAKKAFEKLKKERDKYIADGMKGVLTLSDGKKQTKQWTGPQATAYAKNKYGSLLTEAEENLKAKQEELNKVIQEHKEQADADAAAYEKVTEQVAEQTRKVQELSQGLEKLKAEQLDKVKQELSNLGVSTEGIESVQDLRNKLDSLEEGDRDKILEVLRSIGVIASESCKGVDNLSNSVSNSTEKFKELDNSLENFKRRATYFFGIANGFMLFRRAVSSAINTVKDLDAVMTQTAVVTSNTVGDMWKQLPEYTKRANELGVSIHDVYESATLYYQQGLNDIEVTQLSIETLKMARIANLDAAEATSRMTNALRGFNMELNETNAQRVNDVYSKLAAITASDTNEISTAMTKVASLAHNANMEFETTSAFLAQMIETTRESAETAGTALKTVVARFSEVKELYSKGDLMGTDEEGQEIDVNKVSKALRSAGINLNDYLAGAKGLDDIFMELAGKWQSLDKIQQRYIATMAAGSRQQSRFIAMMSDYSRTVELVNAANNSAGASEKQFEKTLDSLQSKLAMLQNSWHTFLMGIANNEAIKGVVDILKILLDRLNDLFEITDKFTGDFGGAATRVAAVAILFKTLKVSIDALIDSIRRFITKKNEATVGTKLNTEAQKENNAALAQSIPAQEGATAAAEANAQANVKGALAGAANAKATSKLGFISKIASSGLGKFAVAAGGVALAISAVSLAVKGVIWVINKFKPKSLAKKLEEAKKSAEDAGKAADKAANQYNELNTAINSLKESYDTVNTYVKGTKEWYEQVKNLNTEVLKLMETYDGLKVSNKEGVLTIENLDEVLNKYAEYSRYAQVAYLGMQSNVNSLTEQSLSKDAKDIGKNFITYDTAKQKYSEDLAYNRSKGRNLDSYWDVSRDQVNDAKESWTRDLLNSGEIEVAATKLATGEMSRTVEAVKEYFKNVGYYTDITEEDVEKLVTLGRDISELQTKQENNLASFRSYAVMGTKVKEGTENETSNFLTDGQIQSLITKYRGQYTTDKYEKDDLREEVLKNSQYKTYKEYKDATGQDLEELSFDELAGIRAWQRALDESIDSLTNFTNNVESLPEEIRKIYSREDFVVFNDKELEDLSGGFNIEDYKEARNSGRNEDAFEEYQKLEKKLEELWNDEQSIRNAYSGDREKFFVDAAKAITKSQIASNDLKGKYTELGIDASSLDKLGVGTKQDLINKLQEVVDKSGVEGAQVIFEDLLDMIEGFETPEQIEEFFKLISNGDWESLNFFENIPNLMKEFGVFNLDMTQLTTHMKEYNEAVKKVDMESLIKQFGDLEKFGADIKKGEQGRTGISEDIVNRLIESEKVKKQDFVKNADGTYMYQGESLDRIIDAIYDLGDMIGADLTPLDRVGKTIDELRESGDVAGIKQRALDSGMSTEIYETYQGEDKTAELAELTKVYEKAQSFEIDTTSLEQYAKLLKKIKPDLSDVARSQAALANARQTKGFNDLVDSYEDWSKLIKEDGSLLTDLDADQAQALSDMRKGVNNLLNTTEDLPDAFYNSKENMLLLKKAIEEGGDAVYDLKAAALDSIIIDAEVNYDGMDQDVAMLKNFILNEAPTLEIGTELNDKPFMEALKNLLANSRLTAQQVNSLLGSMGVNMTLKAKYDYVSVLGVSAPGNGVSAEQYAQSKKEKVLVGWEWVPGTQSTYTGNVSGGGVKTKSSSSSSGGGKEKNDTWENPYDELYNLTEKINEALRERERLERVYQKTVKKTESTLNAVSKAYYDQIKQLRYEADLQKQMQEGRARQIANVGNEMYMDDEGNRSSFSSLGVTKYANYDTSTGLLQIDWSGLEALEGDPNKVEEGKAAEAYISRLEELQDQFEEVRDKLWDIEDQIEELREEAIENYLSFEDRVMEALVNSYQKQIDDASALFDMIKENTDAVIKGIQEDVALSRQIRDNTKKEEEISDKEARLAYLRRDTSGANALEIKKLEEEIANSRESYSDALVDQQLTQLQDDANKAAEQREHQIEIMQHQLDIAKENGTLWGEVWDLMNTATAGDGTFSQNSELVMLLEDTEAYQSLSAIGQKKWWEQAAEAYKEAMVGLKEAEDKYKTDANGDGKVTSSGTSSAISAVSSMSSSTPSSSATSANTSANTTTASGSGHFAKVGEYAHPKAEMPAAEVKELQQALNAAGFTDNNGKALAVDGKYGPKTMAAVTKLQAAVGTKQDGYYGPNTRKATLASKYKAYKTGGIADFTGPAWLDGSKTHPELVLNAKDTENFITLKDILANLLSGQGGGLVSGGGDNYFTFNIDAEIGSDYDVSKLATQIKKEIYNDSAYRNVNTINMMR